MALAFSYVLNNPLSYTDPSGFFFKKLVRGYMRVTGKQAALRWIGKQSYLSGVISAGLNFVPGCQVWCTAAFNASMTFVQTGSLNASLRTGAITAGASLAFQAIGAEYAGLSKAGGIAFGGNYLTAGQIAGQIITHAFVGGVSTALSGGKFGHGFISAGVTKGLGGAFLPAGGDLPAIAYGTVVSALIGGTTSKLVGGKFANGAQTAAMQYVLNQVGEKSTFQKMRQGAEGVFEDLFRVRWHERAINGDFGPEEQSHALMADKVLTTASGLYYSDAQIVVDGKTVDFRSEVNNAAYEAIINNKAYFAGRQMAQGAMVGLASRYSGIGFAGGAIATTSFTTTAGFGRGLRLFDQGVRDPVSLISRSIVGK